MMGANDELWQLYQKETSVDVKKQILSAMLVGGNVDADDRARQGRARIPSCAATRSGSSA